MTCGRLFDLVQPEVDPNNVDSALFAIPELSVISCYFVSCLETV